MPAMKIVLFFCLVMLVCSSAVQADELEMLLGVSTDFDAGTVTFDVVSSGCTDKRSFRIDLENGVLTVFRVRKDTCKALPEKTHVTFSATEIGLNPHKPFAIANPFLINENLANVVVLPMQRSDRGNE